jgi:hypothetical protein
MVEATEVTTYELLGAYTKAEDEAMNIAFGVCGKKRLNRVFDVIGFVYPDYCFLARKQGTKRKIASTTPYTAPKPKKMKVATHQLKSYFLERAAILPTAGGSKTQNVESTEDTLLASEVILFSFFLALNWMKFNLMLFFEFFEQTMKIPAAAAKVPTIHLEKTTTESSKTEQHPKLQSSLVVPGLSRIATALAVTPRKGRRMANVLDVVLRPLKMATPAPTRILKDRAWELEEVVVVSAAPECTKAGPSEIRPTEHISESLPKRISLPIPEAVLTRDLEFIIRHASGKQLTQKQIVEAQHYARDLKYPRGSLVYEGD